MNSNDIKAIKKAINYLNDNDSSKFEDGMLILYKLVGMHNVVKQIEKIRNAKGIKLTELNFSDKLILPK